MASITLGRVNCPIGCGHTAAQVKIKTDKGEGKTAFPYIHCAGCGIQVHTRGDEQARHLAKMTRPEKGAAPQPAPGAPAAPPAAERTPGDTSAPPEAKKAPGGFLSGFSLGGF
jgi:hypothetical protein